MCKKINVSLNYKEVGVYLKYSTPHPFFLEIKEECKVFCVKLILWSIVAQKGTNILFFYISESGAEYGAECSAESGAYFIPLRI